MPLQFPPPFSFLLLQLVLVLVVALLLRPLSKNFSDDDDDDALIFQEQCILRMGSLTKCIKSLVMETLVHCKNQTHRQLPSQHG